MTNPAMTPPESTEPRTVAQMVIKKTISDMAENSIYDGIPAQLYAEEIMDVLEQHGYTIAPTEPGRVVIILDREEAYALRMGLTDLLTGPDGTHHQPCACLVCEMARELLDRIPPAAAERAATGGA